MQFPAKRQSLPPTPILSIGVETATNIQNALLNSGADTNVMPVAVYNKLKNKAATSTCDVLYSFDDVPITSLCISRINLCIKNRWIQTEFQIINCDTYERVILGKPWIYEHRCVIDYAKLQINFTIGANQYYTSMLQDSSDDVQSKPQETICKPIFPSQQSRKPRSKANRATPHTKWVWRDRNHPPLHRQFLLFQTKPIHLKRK